MDQSSVSYVFYPFHIAGQMDGEDAMIVALLHDVVESTDTTLADLVACDLPPGFRLAQLLGGKRISAMDRRNANQLRLCRVGHNEPLVFQRI